MTQQDGLVLEISLSAEEGRKVEELTRKRGYQTPNDYVRALIESDIETEDDEDEIDPIASFRQAWREIMTDDIRPISELWDALDEKE